MEELNIIKDDLDRVGCGFCLAKWTQVTMHLQNGTNHSCHHPGAHKIPLEEIEQNPKALHNTKFKKLRRREMLTGKRPDECEYCWNIEDNSNQFSDRIYKSSEPWSLPHYQQIIESRWNEDINPRYVEVSFSNTCNFKCSYCGPMYSSQWVQELKKHGDYPNDIKNQSTKTYLHSEHNPYVDAFWEWWPELYQDLDNFRITGGEPLLSKDTWKVLDYILEQKKPNSKLKFAINTNLGVEDELIDRLINKLEKIIDENRVEEVILFTSIDAYGKQSEYIRHGLDVEKFWVNVDKILTKLHKVTITVMSTYNLLSPFTYNDLINKIYEIKVKHQNQERYWNHAILLDTSYLRYPKYLSVKLLSDEHKELILRNAEEALYLGTPLFDRTHIGMSEIEITKIKRIYDWAISESNEDFTKDKNDFVTFVDEHDKRRGTNFIETFPELTEFYNNIKNGN